MGVLGDLIKAVFDAMQGGRAPTQPPPRKTSRRPSARPPAHRPDGEISPGESGSDATVEVDPHRIGPVRMNYSPETDGAPDPGEVVWTWVPFEENDGRGKDRPVLVLAAESEGTFLGAQ